MASTTESSSGLAAAPAIRAKPEREALPTSVFTVSPGTRAIAW
jgi:hypothetical protein